VSVYEEINLLANTHGFRFLDVNPEPQFDMLLLADSRCCNAAPSLTKMAISSAHWSAVLAFACIRLASS